MAYRWRVKERSASIVAGFGAVLFVSAAAYHLVEITAIDEVGGPLLALALDGTPAAGLVYAGYRLSGTDLGPELRWHVVVWCFSGALLLVAVVEATVLVRAIEGREVAESVFPLLVSAGAGGLGGALAGYYSARARSETREARTVSEALAFVNDLIRHDLRNDLNVIAGHVQLLDAEVDPDDDLAEDVAVAEKKVDEALARIETTDAVTETLVGEPDLESVDLASVTAEMASRIDEAHDVEVTTGLPDRARVTANAGVRSVVDNLLENAVEHNDAADPRVHAEVERAETTVRLYIHDNGPGIPDERKETLFEASNEDSGGGLYLAATLVEGFGGSIRVEDNEPRGTTFVVELPRADVE